MGEIPFSMKKCLLIFLFTGAVLCSRSQSPFNQVLKNYFRVHPFDMRFTTFIANLRQDPWFTIELFNLRTDTSFFLVSGTYKNYNPFHFPAKEVRLIVAEDEYRYGDSSNAVDTIINLQMMGIIDTGADNKKEVLREFNRFHNRTEKLFYDSQCEPFISEGIEVAGICDYYLIPNIVPPLTTVWGKLQDHDLLTFTIIIRFKLSENIAYPYMNPYSETGF